MSACVRCHEKATFCAHHAAERAVALRVEVERLCELIEQVEWARQGCCPWCREPDHTPDCPAFSARSEVRR